MKKGRIIILSGPSGSGKTTLYRKLLADKRWKGRLVRSVSLTTRLRRKGEQNGRDYFFVSRKRFLYKQRAGHLLESQKVYLDYYGTPFKPVREFLAKGRHVLLAIEVKGAGVVRKRAPESLMIFIKPPSLTVLRKRLALRGTESAGELTARLKRARMELTEAKKYHHVLVNDDLTACYRELSAILDQELTPE